MWLNYGMSTWLKIKTSKVAQSFPTLCNPMDCSPPGSPVRRILQTRTLERVAIPFSRGSSQSSNRTQVSWIAGRFLKLLKGLIKFYNYICSGEKNNIVPRVLMQLRKKNNLCVLKKKWDGKVKKVVSYLCWKNKWLPHLFHISPNFYKNRHYLWNRKHSFSFRSF